jgi:hypothetical protein
MRANRDQADPIPPPSPRDRILARQAHAGEGNTALFAVMLGVLAFLLVVALSVRQLAAPANTQRLIEAGIASITDIDAYIAENRESLREAASLGDTPGITAPGFPLKVSLTRDEALKGSNEELRSALLARSAALVYSQGVGAFDRTGSQSLSTFSAQGILKFALGQLSQDTHDRATTACIILTLLVALAAIGVVLRNEGFVRLRALGVATLGAGLLGVALTLLLRFAAGSIWSSDPFGDDLAEIVSAGFGVPLRNFAVLAGLGLTLTAGGVAFRVADGFLTRATTLAGPVPEAMDFGDEPAELDLDGSESGVAEG